MLLSLSSSSLSVLTSNPPPPSSAQQPKYPFVSLRKSLRLWIEDNTEALDEAEKDISFVYSGYAPISIRLVQCLTQRDAILSNPTEKDRAEAEGGGPDSLETGKLQAHPIVGWKGFEDLISTIPGETVDVVQKPARGHSHAPISPLFFSNVTRLC